MSRIIGYSDNANHLLKSRSMGYSDGTNHKVKERWVGGADGTNHKVWSSEPGYTVDIINAYPSCMEVGLTPDGYLYLKRLDTASRKLNITLTVTLSEAFLTAAIGLDLINNSWGFTSPEYYAAFWADLETGAIAVQDTSDTLPTGYYSLHMASSPASIKKLRLTLYCSSYTTAGGSVYGKFTLTSPDGTSITPHS